MTSLLTNPGSAEAESGINKQCIRCGKSLPLSAFYTHPEMRDGHLNKCIQCCVEYAKVRYSAARPRIR